MKRSEINQIMTGAKAFMAERHFLLPPWAYWGMYDWQEHKHETSEIIENMLGWDITDFGSGKFFKRGLFLFTIRNGRLNVDKKSYAEKIMIVEENQETPMHYHWSKMEDIINRGGGNLVIELFKATPDNGLSDSPVDVKIDSIKRTVSGGEKIILTPGESICLEQGVYHRFYGEPGTGKVLVGEVSSVNDDHTDNCFYENVGRFPAIEEDEPPLHLLVGDYKKFL
jgi:D-lyxose ketol-isomerase